MYQTVYFEMSDEQRRIYNKLRDEYIAELREEEKPVAEVLKRMIRLQMVTRNYYPPEDIALRCPNCPGVECQSCGGLGMLVERTKLQRIDPEYNPSQTALERQLNLLHYPSVIWCMFRQDVDDAIDASLNAGRKPVRFDGSVPPGQREDAYNAFRAGECDDIVATIRSGLSRGRDLTIARTGFFYSNEFALRARRQAEDRTEGLARTISTDVIDFVAEDTRDVDIIEALRRKRSLADLIVGDPPEKWI
jgi:SNF2 family DNA or RNA helicase